MFSKSTAKQIASLAKSKAEISKQLAQTLREEAKVLREADKRIKKENKIAASIKHYEEQLSVINGNLNKIQNNKE